MNVKDDTLLRRPLIIKDCFLHHRIGLLGSPSFECLSLKNIAITANIGASYYAAIKQTRAGLKYNANPGLAEVEQADKLRPDKKFAEAGKLY